MIDNNDPFFNEKVIMSDNENKLIVVPVDAVNSRFDKLESKIDKLSDAMISLARTEEKIMSMEADRAHMIERLNKHSEKFDLLNERLAVVDSKIAENTRITTNINRVIWGIVVAVSGTIVQFFIR